MELLRTMKPTVSYPPADSKSWTKAGTNRLAHRTVLTAALSAASHNPLSSAAAPTSSVEGVSLSTFSALVGRPSSPLVGFGDRSREPSQG